MGAGAFSLEQIGAGTIHGGSRALYDQAQDYQRTEGPQRGFGRRVFGTQREERYNHSPVPLMPPQGGGATTDFYAVDVSTLEIMAYHFVNGFYTGSTRTFQVAVTGHLNAPIDVAFGFVTGGS